MEGKKDEEGVERERGKKKEVERDGTNCKKKKESKKRKGS